MKTLLALGVALLVAAGEISSAQEAPCVYPREDQVDARVSARVTQSRNGFDYHYLVENRRGAPQTLIRFAVEGFASGSGEVAQASAAGWESRGRLADTAFYSWRTFHRPSALPPGTSATGFRFVHADLPSIVTFLAWNYADPPSFAEGMAPDSCQGDDIIENSFKGATLGPKPPPKDFVPVEFLNYLIALLHDSRQLGWVREKDEHQKLLKTLLGAKRRLERNEPGKAAHRLEKFVERVEKDACRDFRCRKEMALTSEAFALLFFNGRYLLDRLPQPHRGHDDDRDDDKDD